MGVMRGGVFWLGVRWGHLGGGAVQQRKPRGVDVKSTVQIQDLMLF